MPHTVPSVTSPQGPFDYNAFYENALNEKKRNDSYRIFTNINRLAAKFPQAHTDALSQGKVDVWCANDYLGMSRNPNVIETIQDTLKTYGAGSGGTRNISGHNQHAVALEATVADLHHKEAGLVFSSCYTANDSTLSTLGSRLPNCVILSDALNHASMIEGIRHSNASKMIFKHNDMADLETKLASLGNVPKIIAFESVYSMSGSVGKIREICALAKKYGALTFLDEVHAVGIYGPTGAGVAEHLDWSSHVGGHHRSTLQDQVDIISGTFGKAYGCVGGYVASSHKIIDFVRSMAPGFIFTTSLPPAVMAGARASVEYQRQHLHDRQQQHIHTRQIKGALDKHDIPVLNNPSHIVPVMVGNARAAKQASDMLLRRHGIYVQAINYPTVAVGRERLRVTPTPGHTEEFQQRFLHAIDDVWYEMGLKRKSDWLGMVDSPEDVRADLTEECTPLWSDKQLNLSG